MATQKQVSIYGYFPTEGQKEFVNNKWFSYLKNKIIVERSYPEPDYDNEREICLIKEIAKSDTLPWQREELLNMLDNNEEDKNEEQ